MEIPGTRIPAQSNPYNPIESYGVIGDLHTVALVGKDGSIDWCCMPHFDSPSIFAAVLDHQKGGRFKITPTTETVKKQMYLPETCILITRFLSSQGVAEIIDFMPIRGDNDPGAHVHQIVRWVKVVRGKLSFDLECSPAFDYGRKKHKLTIEKAGAIFAAGTETVGLTSKIKLHGVDGGARAHFTLSEGQSLTFVLRHVERGSATKLHVENFHTNRVFEQTSNYWQNWLRGCKYQGRWREMVRRSALTLKLLTFEPSGAIVAAPTTSLPEEIGGVRNWDYRYTWIRDAAFTVYGFLRLGLTREAERFMDWIGARAQERSKDGSLQIMYGIRGEHKLEEVELHHLEGYRGSAPVRIGNGAYNQLQMDIYGELMDAVYLSNKYSKPISYDLWLHLRRLLGYVCKNWQQKDEGIWEVRGGRQHFVYSKLMCWVALDRGVRLADKRSFPSDRNRWIQVRDEIYEEIMDKGWSEKKKSFVQHYDTDALDASNLILPMTFFISPNDGRMKSTIEATMKELVSDSLVHRYKIGHGASDGIEGGEGSFSMCTFWLVECLTRAGQLSKARLMFEKMLSYANHLGLYAEEIGASGEALGNYPQAFTHLALISAAYNLNRALGD
ncbi:MAG: glycoside hydrolase family 15 protein [Deltaproteobacteria bacterium]|nr:glycoside hydrolase family 15 protein [Deltaproteobacteria bacterium]